MNTKDFIRLGVPLGDATRRATDFVAKFILGGGDKSRLHKEAEFQPDFPVDVGALRSDNCRHLILVLRIGEF
jgi:hypothetical protein